MGRPAGCNRGGKPLCFNRGMRTTYTACHNHSSLHQQTQPTGSDASKPGVGGCWIWSSSNIGTKACISYPIMLQVRTPQPASPSSFSHIARGHGRGRYTGGVQGAFEKNLVYCLPACPLACLLAYIVFCRGREQGTETGGGVVSNKDASDFSPSSSRPSTLRLILELLR